MSFLLAGIFQAVPDAFESVWNFFYAGKIFMGFLLALSVLSISVIVFKALDLRRRLVLPDGAVRAIEAAPPAIGTAEAEAIAGHLRANDSALSRLGILALTGDHADKEEASRAVEASAREEIVNLESGVALLEVVITIAPLLGLLGTVSGLVNVFSNLGDTADHAAIAVGIAEALNTTIAGLAIAVPTVIAHSYFMKKIERMGVRMEILLGRFLAQLHRGDGVPAIAEAQPQPAQADPQVAFLPETTPQPAVQAVPLVQTSMPDPGQEIYPQPEVSAPVPEMPVPVPDTPAPAPVEDPSFPRLLAGHVPEELIEDPETPGGVEPQFAPEPAPPEPGTDPGEESQPPSV